MGGMGTLSVDLYQHSVKMQYYRFLRIKGFFKRNYLLCNELSVVKGEL